MLCNLCPSLREIRVDSPLLFLLGINALAMTWSVWLRYKEPIFTLLVFAIYGPVLNVTILIVSAVIDERLHLLLVQFTNNPALARMCSGSNKCTSRRERKRLLLSQSLQRTLRCNLWACDIYPTVSILAWSICQDQPRRLFTL
jgi:hypothetical protein